MKRDTTTVVLVTLAVIVLAALFTGGPMLGWGMMGWGTTARGMMGGGMFGGMTGGAYTFNPAWGLGLFLICALSFAGVIAVVVWLARGPRSIDQSKT